MMVFNPVELRLTSESPGDCVSGQYVSCMVGVDVSASLLRILPSLCVCAHPGLLTGCYALAWLDS